MSIRPIVLCFGLAVMSGFAVTAHATYTVTVLADPGGMGNNTVYGINASGESVGVSGSASPCCGFDAVLWSATGTATVLQDVPGGVGHSQAVAINASGQTVGASLTATGEDPVLWSSSGAAPVLGKGGGYPSFALAVNAKGWSVGYVKTQNGLEDAVLWRPN